MGKFDALKKLFTKEQLSGNKIPYKVKNDQGLLTLESPKAKASGSILDYDSVSQYNPEVSKYVGDLPFIIETLEAEKGFGSKALKQLEQSAKKRGADSAFLNASPLGGTKGLSQEDAKQKLIEFYKKNGYEVAEDQGPNAMMYKKALAIGAIPQEEGTMNRLKELGQKFGLVKSDDQMQQGQQQSDEFVDALKNSEYTKALEMVLKPNTMIGETEEEALIRQSMDLASMGMSGMAKAVKPPRNTMIYEPKGKIRDIKGDVKIEPKTTKVYPGDLGKIGVRGGYGTVKTAPQAPEVMDVATAGKNLIKNEPNVQNNLEKLKSNPVYSQRLNDWRNGKINTEAFNSWKQEMLDKIRRGESF